MNNKSLSRKKLNIWQVSREMSPYAEAGGIKDVVAGLSEALGESGHKVTVVLPLYKFLFYIKEKKPLLTFQLEMANSIENITVYEFMHLSIRILFVSADCYNKDQVYTYSRAENGENQSFISGTGHLDCDLMNILLQRCALEIPLRLKEVPHIFHLHDGHTGFLPAILKYNRRYKSYYRNTVSLLTIHNAGIVYQQNIKSLDAVKKLTDLPFSVLEKVHSEHGYNPLLCAGFFGFVNTVSEKYASDIMSGIDESSGTLGMLFRHNKVNLIGITNGISIEKYKIPIFNYHLKPDPQSENLQWKKEYKISLFEKLESLKCENYSFGSLIADPDLPLVTMQSRVTYQKGIDIFYEGLRLVLEKGLRANFLFIGEGENIYEDKLAKFAKGIENFCYIRKYDATLSQHLFAAGDFFIISSRWEPCGLTDFIAQLFGNIPVVHETGGLVKTKNGINGFSYKNNSGESLGHKIEEAVDLYEKKSPELHELRKNAVNLINENYTWEKVLVKRYLPYYRQILLRKRFGFFPFKIGK